MQHIFFFPYHVFLKTPSYLPLIGGEQKTQIKNPLIAVFFIFSLFRRRRPDSSDYVGIVRTPLPYSLPKRPEGRLELEVPRTAGLTAGAELGAGIPCSGSVGVRTPPRLARRDWPTRPFALAVKTRGHHLCGHYEPDHRLFTHRNPPSVERLSPIESCYIPLDPRENPFSPKSNG